MADRLTLCLPAICGLLYLGTSIAFLCERRGGWALTYFSYGLANVGLIIASMR